MNNFKWLTNQKDLERLGHDLCDLQDTLSEGCETCPVNHLCEYGQNGFIVWLRQEHK